MLVRYRRVTEALALAVFGEVADGVAAHSLGSGQGGDDILGVSRDAMLVKVHAFEFAFLGDAEHADLDSRMTKTIMAMAIPWPRRSRQASDALGFEDLPSAAVKQTREGVSLSRGVVDRLKGDVGYSGVGTASRGKLAGREEAERKSSPDAAEAMHGPSADGIIDAEELE